MMTSSQMLSESGNTQPTGNHHEVLDVLSVMGLFVTQGPTHDISDYMPLRYRTKSSQKSILEFQ